MKVILQQDVKKLGKRGATVEVAEGYGRNYLIPRGLAVEASGANLRKLEQEQAVARKRAKREQAEAEALAARLAEITVEIPAKTGEGGRLFGSVNAGDIAQALEDSGVTVDKRKIQLDEPVKSLGTFEVPIRLHSDVVAPVRVKVVEA